MKKWLLSAGIFISTVANGQVHLQTGSAQADFPLFQYADAKSRVSTSLSLHYISGNGLKVNEIASNVGTGWALQAGGVITRIQHGEPDDQEFVDHSTDPPNLKDNIVNAPPPNLDSYYPDGYMYSTISPQNAMNVKASVSPMFPSGFTPSYKHNLEDREQDVFVFQFNGRSGQFVIGKNKEVQILTDSKLKVSFEELDMRGQKIRTKISSFTITDEDGLQYKFQEKEVTEVVVYETSTSVNGYKLYKGRVLDDGKIKKFITKWFLTEIINPATNDKIVFNYNTYAVDMDGPKHISVQTISINGGDRISEEVLVERIKMVTKNLSSIISPDNHRVDFNYAAAERVDLPGDRALTEINIRYNNNLLYGYRFNYGYFLKFEIKPYSYQFPTADKRFARLCLTDFKKVGSDGTALPPYQFTYVLPPNGGPTILDRVPPLFEVQADHWGFYHPNTTSINSDDNGYPSWRIEPKSFVFNFIMADRGIIKKIQYPEGGSLEFEYEHNIAEASPYTNKYSGGVRVSRTILYDGNSHANDVIKQYKYIKADGTSSAWGFEQASYVENKTLRQYKTNSGTTYGFNFKDLASSFSVGLLVSRAQALKDGAMSGSMFNASSIANAAYQVIIVYVIGQLIDIFFSDPYRDYTISIIKSDNINSTNPLPMQYARVEVIDAIYSGGALTGTNGKVAYEFTDDQFKPLRVPSPFPAPYSTAKQRAAHWVYGLPRFITWYNAASQPVKKIENQYNGIIREINTANHVSRSWNLNTIAAIEYNPAVSQGSASFINSETFYPIQGRTELTKTIETIYSNSGTSTTTETEFTYSPNNYLPRTVSKKDSKGDWMGTTSYYLADYNMPGIINTMKTANIMNAPVSVNTWIKGSQDAGRKLTSSVVTEYTQIGNGDFRPFQVFQSRIAVPLDNTIANESSFDQANFKNYSYLKPHSAIFYEQGNPVQNVAQTGFSIASSIYDYNQRLIVAEVADAPLAEIKYTSFEADGTGGWVYPQSGVVEDYCPTGKKCFDLRKSSIQASLNMPNKPVIISLWTTGSQVIVNFSGSALTPVKTGPVINGWTFYEFELTGITQGSSLSVSGNGLVDELRFYPKNARMKTYTFSPGIGKTSETDPNGRTIYYQYDDLGRLLHVRDENRNLLKAYQYNYKQ